MANSGRLAEWPNAARTMANSGRRAGSTTAARTMANSGSPDRLTRRGRWRTAARRMAQRGADDGEQPARRVGQLIVPRVRELVGEYLLAYRRYWVGGAMATLLG